MVWCSDSDVLIELRGCAAGEERRVVVVLVRGRVHITPDDVDDLGFA